MHRRAGRLRFLRLLGVAIEWLRTGRATLETTGTFRDLLLSIKRGDLPLSDTLREAERLAEELEKARGETVLPPRPDVAHRRHTPGSRIQLADPGPRTCVDGRAPTDVCRRTCADGRAPTDACRRTAHSIA